MTRDQLDVRHRPEHALPLPDDEFASPGAKDTSLLLSPLKEEAIDIQPVSPEEDEREAKVKPKTSEAPKTNAAPNKILFLDGLRGLAAIMVVIRHVGYLGAPVGQPAVDTFFVLSAFLLTMIFEKKARTLIEQGASPRRWMWALTDYFVRRFLRVYPLFALVATYLLVYSPKQKEKLFFVHHPEEYNLWKVLTFEFKYRYHVFWTLPLEIAYYFVIPVFVVGIILLKRFWAIPLLPLCYWIVNSGFYWNRSNHQPLSMHLPTFVCGSIAAIVYVKAEQWITSTGFVFRRWHWLAIRTVEMFFFAVMLSVIFNGLFFDWVMHNPVPRGAGEPFVTVNVAVIIVCEMLLPGALASLLEWSLLRYAGKISFSMYLLHSFVIYSDWVRRQGYWNKFFAIWGLVFLLSSVSYHLVEYPCQWLAGRVGAWIKKKDAEEKQRGNTAPPMKENVDLV